MIINEFIKFNDILKNLYINLIKNLFNKIG